MMLDFPFNLEKNQNKLLEKLTVYPDFLLGQIHTDFTVYPETSGQILLILNNLLKLCISNVSNFTWVV
jgi:hypothetical protein